MSLTPVPKFLAVQIQVRKKIYLHTMCIYVCDGWILEGYRVVIFLRVGLGY